MKKTASEALAAGESFYNTGIPCPAGHKSARRTSNRACIKCQAARNTKDKKTHRLKQRLTKPESVLFDNARLRARANRIQFTLAKTDIKMTECCPCCKKPFVLGAPTGRAVPQAPSLDRIIPEKGYVPQNIIVICSRCNTLKRDGTLEEFQTLLEWMKTL